MDSDEINDFQQTDTFRDWLGRLKDKKAKQRINERIKLAIRGDLGDCETIEGGVIEMKLHLGPGYRLYCYQHSPNKYRLLVGGTKKEQQRDIGRARRMKSELEGEGGWLH
ncbi:MAG: type II toxin-antitoxin system RelE/ParE family toxin [Holophagales bacterium]|nr:type II toxin-antitoxin system RelE/ParE family toxin [Holophagales bacterium]